MNALEKFEDFGYQKRVDEPWMFISDD